MSPLLERCREFSFGLCVFVCIMCVCVCRAEGSISQLRTQMMFDVGGADQLRQIDAQYEEHVTGSGSKPGTLIAQQATA